MFSKDATNHRQRSAAVIKKLWKILFALPTCFSPLLRVVKTKPLDWWKCRRIIIPPVVSADKSLCMSGKRRQKSITQKHFNGYFLRYGVSFVTRSTWKYLPRLKYWEWLWNMRSRIYTVWCVYYVLARISEKEKLNLWFNDSTQN